MPLAVDPTTTTRWGGVEDALVLAARNVIADIAGLGISTSPNLPYKKGTIGLKRCNYAHLTEKEVTFWQMLEKRETVRAWAKRRFQAAPAWCAIAPTKGLDSNSLSAAIADRQRSTRAEVEEMTGIAAVSLQRPIDPLAANDAVIHFDGGRNIFIDRSRARPSTDSDEAKLRAKNAKPFQKLKKTQLICYLNSKQIPSDGTVVALINRILDNANLPPIINGENLNAVARIAKEITDMPPPPQP